MRTSSSVLFFRPEGVEEKEQTIFLNKPQLKETERAIQGFWSQGFSFILDPSFSPIVIPLTCSVLPMAVSFLQEEVKKAMWVSENRLPCFLVKANQRHQYSSERGKIRSFCRSYPPTSETPPSLSQLGELAAGDDLVIHNGMSQ